MIGKLFVIPLPFCWANFVKLLPFPCRLFVKQLPFPRQTTPVFGEFPKCNLPSNQSGNEELLVTADPLPTSPKIQRFVIKRCKQMRAVALAGKNINNRQATAGAVAGINATRKKQIEKSIDKAGTNVPDFTSRFAISGADSLRRLAEPRQPTSMRAPRRELSPATPRNTSTTPTEWLLRFRGVAASCFGSRRGAARRSRRRRRLHVQPIGFTHHIAVSAVAALKGPVSRF